DEVAADRGQADEGADGGMVARGGRAGTVIAKEAGPGVLAWAGEDDVGMGGGFFGERGDVEAAKRDEGAAAAVMVGDFVRAARAGDVDLDDDEIGVVVEAEGADVFVGDFGVVGGMEEGGEGGEAERGEEGVFDGTKEGTGGFRQGGEDEFDEHRDFDIKVLCDVESRKIDREVAH
ncbi:MAG TPA: hypothetical protein VNH18_37100, partial [Bryobacteraceae bacterium]|nr:hypothetical protein [Bryobacteraceae bacterium]